MAKYLKQGFVRELEWKLNREEISYSKMVELMEEECIKNYKAETFKSKEEKNYIVFAEDSTAMMQESLIQQSNPLAKERAIEFAERIKDRDNLFCVTIMKRVSQEELNQNKDE